MREGRAKKYLLWLALLVGAMVFPLIMIISFGKEAAGRGAHISVLAFFGAGFSCAALTMTILVVWWIAYLGEEKIPGWISAIVIYGVIGFLIAPYVAMYADSLWENHQRKYEFYLLLAGMAMFVVNVLTIFLIQSWITIDKLEMSWYRAMIVNWIFAVWMLESLVYSADSLFVATSALATLALVPVAMLVEMLFDRRFRQIVKRLQDIYS